MMSVHSHELLPHFLRWYGEHGVLQSHVRVVVDTSSHTAEAQLMLRHSSLRVRQVLRLFGVGDAHFIDSSANNSVGGLGYERNKLTRLNAFIASLPHDAWVIYADVDEHFVYPCHVTASLRAVVTQNQQHALCSHMVDRLPPLHRPLPLAVRERDDLQAMYPVCLPLREPLRGVCTVKLILLRARVNGVLVEYTGSHTARPVRSEGVDGIQQFGGSGFHSCVRMPGGFSHYTATPQAVISIAQKQREKRLRNKPHGLKIYARFMRLFAENFTRYSPAGVAYVASWMQAHPNSSCPGGR